MFEKAGALDRAAQVIAANAMSVDDVAARSVLHERLAGLYERLDDPSRAAEAFSDAAEGTKNAKLFDAAERNFVASERWDRAGQAAIQRADLEEDDKAKARHLSRGGDYLRASRRRGGSAGEDLVRATELDPANEERTPSS